jgi:hypothetical protein
MTALTENPRYMHRFDEETEIFRRAGLHQDTSNSVRAHPPLLFASVVSRCERVNYLSRKMYFAVSYLQL